MTHPLTFHARPVDPGWTCHRTGDCCRVDRVVLTERERDVLLTYAEKHFTIKKLNTLQFEQARELGFVEMVTTGVCPMLERDGSGKAICSVYEVRPYNCRRFVCFRPDPKQEPIQWAPPTPYMHFGMIGCVNLRERLLHSRVARRLYDLVQRKAQRWALAHGWSQGLV